MRAFNLTRSLILHALLLPLVITSGALQNLPFCQKNFSSDPHAKVKFALSDKINDFCDVSSIDVPVMMDTCSKFCAPGVPLLLGTSSKGFHLDELDQVCIGAGINTSVKSPVRFNQSHLKKCTIWSKALQDVNMRAADFVAAEIQTSYEQIKFRAIMLDKVKELQTKMNSEETKAELKRAGVGDEIRIFKEILEASLKDVLTGGLASRDLRKQMEELEKKAEILEKSLSSALPQVKRFYDECNELFTGVSATDVYLLDICATRADFCIESKKSSHVGCCCGVLPTAGSFTIDADTKVSKSRRLTSNNTAVVTDVCGAAYQNSDAAVQKYIDDIKTYGRGTQLLNDHYKEQKETYPDFLSNCGRRLQEAANNSVAADSQRGQDAVEPEGTMERTGTSLHRQLTGQKYLTCDPPAHKDLLVAFTEKTENGLCIDQSATTDEKMNKECEAFCAPTAIPLNLGSRIMGFSLEDMNQICLRPQPYDNTAVKTCLEQGAEYRKLQDKTAAFVSSLSVLDWERVAFKAEAMKATTELQRLIQEKGDRVLKDAAQSEKMMKYAELLSDGLTSLGSKSNAKRILTEATASVKQKGDELLNQLKISVPTLRKFLDNCNNLFTGVGPKSEYLLDMCSQDSQECIEKTDSKHRGCCCGYNPILALNRDETSGTGTIDGISSSSFKDARVKAARRASTSDKKHKPTSICGKASQLSASDIAQIKDRVRKTPGGQTLLDNRRKENKAKYPAFIARCKQADNLGGTIKENANGATTNALPIIALLICSALAM